MDPAFTANKDTNRDQPAQKSDKGGSVGRAGDVILACILIVLTAPLMAVVAVAIKLDSLGPVICRGEGVWVDGRHRTDLFKFRTKSYGADGITPSWSWTRVGRYLYLTRIDELPELFNVLRGDLRLFGPQARALVVSRRRR
jgi:lipopolysaccharide/colanic/teichoic acid biosynthesis glycosyltransferase